MEETLLLLLGNAMKLTLFGIGTLAFFAAVYLSIKHPELVDTPGEVKQDLSDNPLRKWDTAIAWVMWGGWGCAGTLTFLVSSGYLDMLKP
jgi:hypothetical protein